MEDQISQLKILTLTEKIQNVIGKYRHEIKSWIMNDPTGNGYFEYISKEYVSKENVIQKAKDTLSASVQSTSV